MIRLAGSDTLGAKLVLQWTEAFRQHHPEIELQFSAEGSSNGFAALAEERCDSAMASRLIKPERITRIREKRNEEISSYLARLSPLATIVHEDNSASNLTLSQLRKICAGEINNWKLVGGIDRRISLHSRISSSGSYHMFKKRIMGGTDFGPDLQKLVG